MTTKGLHNAPELSSTEITTAGCYHTPVLLFEALDALNIAPNGTYIDATFGGGGHSKEILKRLGKEGHLFGVDRDLDALEGCNIKDDRFTFIRSDFRHIENFMKFYGVTRVDGILADLGVSSHHLDDHKRGFSFRFSSPIDMRMNQASDRTAAGLIRNSSLEGLTQILKEYGEVSGARRIASKIKEKEESGELSNIDDLVDAISPNPERRDKKLLAQVFQALRISVNDEIGALSTLLKVSSQLLRPEGRLAVITYHSLEDRPVKNFIRTGNIKGERITDTFGKVVSSIAPLKSRPILPTPEEIERNPRARSAKLRVGVKLNTKTE